jgi:uncharacterized cupredoxin-like copper-binding protein
MRWAFRSAVVFAVLALAGCASSQPAGPAMMNPPTGYHFSRLTCAAPALPGRGVTVMVGDMGMTHMMNGTAPLGAPMMLRAQPSSVPAGPVSLVVENVGWRTHELVVLSLAPGAVVGQRAIGADGKVDESGSLGEASASCRAGSGDGIDSGAVGWTTLTLQPGRYELVCNLPNHYADGMRQELDVTAS